MNTSKIIRGVVGGGRYTVTAPIVKEDYGLYLKLEGLELPATYEVDFSNDEHNGTSVTMIGNSDGVLIPSQFISSGKDIFAFLYHVGVDFGRTVYKFRIPNKLRPDRTDEQPTPEEQSVIDQAISALNTAVEQTAQDVIDADASAQSASQSAENAHDSAVDAQNFATQAEQSAQNAYTYALSANGASDTALQSAELAQTLANNAQASASASAQSATASANSASQASASATSASQSASSAQWYASQAQTSAQTASTKASEASTSASTASAKATESAQSASLALGYKNDAESAKTASQTAQGLAESARDDSEQIKSDVQDLADGIDTRLVDVEDGILKAFPTDTASGAIASFTDGADGLPLKSLVVDINPVQDLSQGDPSPENICPISGWTQVDVEQRGKNLLQTPYYDRSKTEYGITFTVNNDGSVSLSGTNNRERAIYYDFVNRDFPKKLKKGSYFVGRTGIAGVTFSIVSRNADNTQAVALAYANETSDKVFTLSEDTLYYSYLAINAGVTVNATFYPRLELGSTATSYEPYQGNTYTIQLPTEAGTVYGGTLDVTNGVLTVDRYLYVYDGTETGFRKSSTALNGFYNFLSSVTSHSWPKMADYNGISAITDEASSMMIPTKNVDTYKQNYGYVFFDSGHNFNVPPEEFGTTIESFKAKLASLYADGTPLSVFCKIATPITVQLSANQINSLLGVNNIWADTGDTTAEYRADPTLYIQRLTEPDADMIADSNIVSGQYFMVGNSLFKATANIANGASIIVGTNCIRKSLSEALNEINA